MIGPCKKSAFKIDTDRERHYKSNLTEKEAWDYRE